MNTIQGYPVVSDDSAPLTTPENHGRGYEPRDYEAFPLNGQPHNRAATIERLDDKAIRELIAQKTADKSWLSDLADRVGSKVKNQSQSNYCWDHAPTRGMEYALIESGGVALTLSAFYSATKIKGGRNEGGSGVEAVNWLAKHGTCIESMWPPMQFRGQYTPEIEANAALHQITIYEEFDAHDMQLIYSSIVQNQAVTVGIPAWGHEVLLTFLAIENGIIYPGFDNSWGVSYGNNGRGVLHGKMTRFDEAGRIAAIESSAA